MVRGARRSPTPATWLTAVESATAAFTGTARVVADTPARTTGRGSGRQVTAEITPDRAVFGDAPGAPVTVDGDTSLPAERRTGPDEPRFPPDTLRAVPYADQARPGRDQPVLCLLTQPPVVRALTGAGDELPRAVALIHSWSSPGDVDRSLAQPAPAICYPAAFEYLARTTGDLPGLAEKVLRPAGAGARGVLDLLQARAAQLPDPEVVALAERLLPLLAAETDPEAVVAYLAWFSAQQPRLAALAPAVRDAARQAADRTYDGDWAAEVSRHADAVTR